MENVYIQFLESVVIVLLCGYFVLAATGGFQKDFDPIALPKGYDLEKGYSSLRLTVWLLPYITVTAWMLILFDKN